MKKTPLLEKIITFFKKGKRITCKKGETIISRQQSKIPYIYYVEKGYIHQYRLISGKPVSINMYKPRSYFPYTHIVNRTSNTFTYTTLSDAILYVVSRSHFLKFLEENNDIFYDITMKLSMDFNLLVSIIEALTQHNSRSKIMHILLVYAKLLGIRKNKNVIINIPLTHLDIANVAGISRETATREMAYLVKQKLIKKKNNRYWIYNQNKLYKELK